MIKMDYLRRIRTRAVVVAAATVLALTGCGHDTAHGRVAIAAGASPSPSPSRAAFDPPTRFDAGSAVGMPAEVAAGNLNLAGTLVAPMPAVLQGTVLFVATLADLRMVDALTGQVRATISPQHKAIHDAGADDADPIAGQNPVNAPLLVDLDGVPTVLSPVLVTVAGQGTTPSSTAAELMAVDADSGKLLWSFTVPIDAAADGGPSDSDVQVVGVSGSMAVLRASGDSYGVDLVAKRVAWRQKSFAAATVTGDVVSGVVTGPDQVTQRLAAFGVADGAQRWTDSKPSTDVMVQAGGPKYVMITGVDYGSGKAYYRLAEAATGKTIESDQASVGYHLRCRYDQVGVTVCDMDNWVSGFDASTGKWLWELPDKATNRTAITVTAAWHGAVYGSTGNGPVVLDARTGADRQDTPGAAPFLVDGSIGIAQRPGQQGLFSFVATG